MNFQRGNRVFYDSLTGKKLWDTGEVWESSTPTPHEEIMGEIKYVDLELGEVDAAKYYIESIDLETKKPVLKKYDWVLDDPTPEEAISKLEEELALIKEQQLVGGIA
ncbi:hypothetical protein ACIQV0_10415 [Lysinibacillus capsici]|uniref:hypothetical protein n=1 Tax=Lysinibacillus capsici TaxID=2115968 RepID=UPI003807C8B9